MKYQIIANWKMNPLLEKEALSLFNSIRKKAEKFKKSEIIICPPFLFLFLFKNKISKNLKIGAQNCFFEEKGAFTGEISLKMLKNFKVEYVILGHSERRRYFGETDEMINKKIKASIKNKINPILCIGETLKERRENKTFKVLERQIKTALKGISQKSLQRVKLSLAYEPVWAIGKGKSCSEREIEKASLFIKKILAKLYSISFFKRIKVLYGGSVNEKNAKKILKEGRVEGLLIGSASLKKEVFIKILKEVEEI